MTLTEEVEKWREDAVRLVPYLAERLKEEMAARALAEERQRYHEDRFRGIEERDPLHPTGRCVCNGEGWCLHCMWVAVSEECEALKATAATDAARWEDAQKERAEMKTKLATANWSGREVSDAELMAEMVRRGLISV